MYPKKTKVCWIQPPQTGLFHCKRRIFVVSCGVAIRVSDGQNKGGSRNHSHPFCHWFLDTCPIPNPISHVWSLHLASTIPTFFFNIILHHEVWNRWTFYYKVQKVESHFFGDSIQHHPTVSRFVYHIFPIPPMLWEAVRTARSCLKSPKPTGVLGLWPAVEESVQLSLRRNGEILKQV